MATRANPNLAHFSSVNTITSLLKHGHRSESPPRSTLALRTGIRGQNTNPDPRRERYSAGWPRPKIDMKVPAKIGAGSDSENDPEDARASVSEPVARVARLHDSRSQRWDSLVNRSADMFYECIDALLRRTASNGGYVNGLEGTSSSNHTPSTLTTTGETSRKSEGKRRKRPAKGRPNDRNTENSDSDVAGLGPGRKRMKGGDSEFRQFACPYIKKYPARHGGRKSCSAGYCSIDRLK